MKKSKKTKNKKERRKKQSKHHLFDFGQLISTSASWPKSNWPKSSILPAPACPALQKEDFGLQPTLWHFFDNLLRLSIFRIDMARTCPVPDFRFSVMYSNVGPTPQLLLNHFVDLAERFPEHNTKRFSRKAEQDSPW